jgi:hypothetical protein
VCHGLVVKRTSCTRNGVLLCFLLKKAVLGEGPPFTDKLRSQPFEPFEYLFAAVTVSARLIFLNISGLLALWAATNVLLSRCQQTTIFFSSISAFNLVTDWLLARLNS